MAGLDFEAKSKMKSNSLKSQVTMLMILGLVMFIVISLVLYLSKSAVKKQSQQNIKKTQDSAAEIQPIKEFAAKCLDKLAKDALVLIGRQGGYIYSSQGGTLVDYQETDEGLFFVGHEGMKVAYNIQPPKFAIPPYASDVPDYPWKTFPYRTAGSSAEIFEGFFGIINIPPLNSSEGPNSIQSQIESFIDSNIAGCIDSSIFEKQGLKIQMQQPKTSAIIGSGNIAVSTSMPISISNPATNEYAELEDFSATLDIGLRGIYFFAKDIMENDIRDIRFNMSSVKNNKGSLRIKVIKDAFSSDDLAIITDDQSLINGKPYEYIFARKNRAPALYYIKKNEMEFPHNFEIKQDTLLKNYELKAEDPDEDSYRFTITPELPKVLNIPQIKFKVEVSDGQHSDYQIITVNRIE
jgi:hypothetical protein